MTRTNQRSVIEWPDGERERTSPAASGAIPDGSNEEWLVGTAFERSAASAGVGIGRTNT